LRRFGPPLAIVISRATADRAATSFRASVRALGSATDSSARDELAGDGAKLTLAVAPHVGTLTEYTLQLIW
jgi:hypothetical protein